MGDANFPFSARAVYGLSDMTQPSANHNNIGGFFRAENALLNYGVYARSVSTLSGAVKYGVYAEASGGSTNYAIYGTSLPISGTTPPSGPNYAGYFDGDVYISGSFGPSDLNLKHNINSLDSALFVLQQLHPKKFEFNAAAYPSMNLPQGIQYGLIAQDVEPILPELVTNNVHPAILDSLGNIVTPAVNFKGLEYQQLIPFLLKGIQEQQAQIENKDSLISNLNDRLIALENCINALNLCGNPQAVNQNNNNMNTTAIPVELSDAQAIVLEQNVPNPFAEQTTINYFLPENVTKAQMLFYNAQGKLIQSVELSQKGKGSINVFAQDLSSGIYTYTLVADGKIVETKKMIKQ